jgi:hypothetical protein
MVFFNGRSTTCPGPIVHGPPINVTKRVLMLTEHIILIAICNAAPVALFSLFPFSLRWESAVSYWMAEIILS